MLCRADGLSGFFSFNTCWLNIPSRESLNCLKVAGCNVGCRKACRLQMDSIRCAGGGFSFESSCVATRWASIA